MSELRPCRCPFLWLAVSTGLSVPSILHLWRAARAWHGLGPV